METTPHTVRETLAKLRELPPIPSARRVAALERFWALPPPPSPRGRGSFPWAQVRLGVVALAQSAPHCSEPSELEKPGVLALILAGNTPLLAWPTLHYAVLLGIRVFIKQSRDETIWTRHFVETLAEIDPEVAALLHLDLFPGDDPRTRALVQDADAVIAYGGDEAIAALRDITPDATPFQSFGHALSVGIWTGEDSYTEFNDSLTCAVEATLGFAHDFLVYDQAGCLSLQAIFMQKSWTDALREMLLEGINSVVHPLCVPPRTDPAECRLVREARDLARMEGCEVFGDSELRWTLIIHPEACVLPAPVGRGVLHLIPLNAVAEFGRFLGSARGRLSCVGVAGELSEELRAAIAAEGVSRVCPAGQMQLPPLDWHNGGVDLGEWLRRA